VAGSGLTMLDLFKTDFKQTLKLKSPFTVLVNGHQNPAWEQVYLDHDALAWFVGYFVPHGSATEVLCRFFADHYQETYDRASKAYQVDAGQAGQPELIKMTDLHFAGRVVIYYEDFLSARQIADIEDWYKARGLFVTMLGPDYLSSQSNRPVAASAGKAAKDAAAPAVHIEQKSEGANSPNIVGNNNTVVVPRPPDRVLSDTAHSTLVTALLKAQPAKVRLLRDIAGGDEVARFATALRDALVAAHWTVIADNPAMVADAENVDVIVLVKDPQNHPQGAELLVGTLKSLGFSVAASPTDDSELHVDEVKVVINVRR
jgi:hypothetical protein